MVTQTPNVGEERQLYNGDSSSVYSPPFRVLPAHVGVLKAYGIGRMAAHVDKEKVRKHQAVCLNMLLYDAGKFPKGLGCGEDPTFSWEAAFGALIAEETVITNNCCWELTACHNVGVITVPGQYRLMVNDDNMLKKINVTLDSHPRGSFIDHSMLIF